MRLVIQLPALNEAESIGKVLDAIPRDIPGIDDLRVVVVDDGSTDDTGAIAREKGAHVIRHSSPKGVGAAFRTGLAESMLLNPDLIVTMDADGQFNPDHIPLLLAPIVEGECDFVSGSRFADSTLEPDMPKAKRWGNRVIAQWLSKMTGQEFHDVSCGFRAYSRKAFLRLNPQGEFTYTHEVFLALAFAGLRIREVPVEVRGVREHGTSRVAGNLPRYAYRAASIILGTYRDYQPLKFFGLIALALFVPGFLLLAFLAVHWLQTGALFPYRAVGFAGGAMLGSSLLVFLVGLMASMLTRLRTGLETALVRVGELEGNDSRNPGSKGKLRERD